jgi:hypothetical protein
MAEIWVRIELKGLQPDFADLLRMAQPYDPFLGRIRLASFEMVPCEVMGEAQSLVMFVPSSYVEYWTASADGDVTMEHMAEADLTWTIFGTLEDRGCLPAPTWGWGP